VRKIDFHFDFETRSRADLRKVGAVRYATDPSTEATLLTWCFGRTGAVKAWRIGQPLPQELHDVLSNPAKYNFIAWNITFDYLIWSIPFSKQVSDFPVRPKVADLTDAMALSQHYRTGASLESAANFFNLPMTKDKLGRRIMLKSCKPNRHGEFVELTTEEWEHFERYGIIDTVLLRDIYYRLPPLPAAERWIFEWCVKRNLRGIAVDADLINEMASILDEVLPKLESEFKFITGNTTRSPKCKEWFKKYYPYIENMQAATVREMLRDKTVPDPAALRELKLKDLSGSSSIAKVYTAKNMMVGGRIYDLIAYHMAQTKRFAGRGIQIQNFPRPDYKAPDKLPDLNVENLVSAVKAQRPMLQDHVAYVKNLLRRIWIPSKGNILYCGDFSKVEPTVLRWLTGMGPVPKLFYEEMASEIYNIPIHEVAKDSEERQIGKNSALGGSYAMGHDKFKDQVYQQTGIVLDDDMAKLAIQTYRRVNKPIVDFWRDLQAGFRRAINGETTRLCDNKIIVEPMRAPAKGVQIRLPSGSYLFYHKAQIKLENKIVEVPTIQNGQTVYVKQARLEENLVYLQDYGAGKIGWGKVYGGLLTEHVTSATARDLLTHAMYQLDQAGFDVLSTVHDEIWGESHAGRDKEFEDTMCILPHWCPDIVLKAEGDNGVRYLK
jgi:DNA polymerase